jgi:hypothetical protein
MVTPRVEPWARCRSRIQIWSFREEASMEDPYTPFETEVGCLAEEDIFFLRHGAPGKFNCRVSMVTLSKSCCSFGKGAKETNLHHTNTRPQTTFAHPHVFSLFMRVTCAEFGILRPRTRVAPAETLHPHTGFPHTFQQAYRTLVISANAKYFRF